MPFAGAVPFVPGGGGQEPPSSVGRSKQPSFVAKRRARYSTAVDGEEAGSMSPSVVAKRRASGSVFDDEEAGSWQPPFVAKRRASSSSAFDDEEAGSGLLGGASDRMLMPAEVDADAAAAEWRLVGGRRRLVRCGGGRSGSMAPVVANRFGALEDEDCAVESAVAVKVPLDEEVPPAIGQSVQTTAKTRARMP